MYRIEHKIIKTEAADYIKNFRDADRFIAYCRECSNYGNIWVCPPYAFDTLGSIKDYKYAYIIGTRVHLDEDIRRSPKDAEDQKAISYRTMEEARKNIDPKLLELEIEYPGSLSFFAGSCFLCRKEDCTRHKGKECIHPDKARSSLEAYGFDITRTTSELLGMEIKWSENLVLPEYFTLVSGFLTDHEINDLQW